MPSTAIRSFHYFADRRELEVTFTTGRRYLYVDVPVEVAAAFASAESKGRFFNAEIRHYCYRELTSADR